MSKKLLAEFIGTFFLVFAGTGAIVVNEITHSLTHMGVALTFGLVVMALIYTFGHISGAHFNPAVTLSFLLRKEITKKLALFYVIIQMVAAIVASITVRLILGSAANLGATLPHSSWQQSFVLEIILTFVLMIVILGSAIHGKAVKSFAGLAIGATIGLEAMFAGPISGASMNPARSLGPALTSGNLHGLWIYIVAPLLGAVLATWIYGYLHEREESDEG
ncbi:MIP/aquaporin family protein [Mechercharimyces sp. CAU 1602]|uniref:MIP/aquaporin family protein n=1 Tax=Mechercharimyces sp. CAU 1602 TaxID=2973933 RepID=UPI00216294F1|nr:MIP family channel protein [Mechercharimyces sp. CAU 1602]MCS1351099.1 MIP family channel protein [Mechercharimyces sp. CAU 1602]